MKNKIDLFALCFLILVCIYSRLSYSQDVEARLYANAPKGMDFVAGSYKYSNGENVVNSAIIEDLKGTMNIIGAGYLHVFGLAGMTAKIDMLAPHM